MVFSHLLHAEWTSCPITPIDIDSTTLSFIDVSVQEASCSHTTERHCVLVSFLFTLPRPTDLCSCQGSTSSSQFDKKNANSSFSIEPQSSSHTRLSPSPSYLSTVHVALNSQNGGPLWLATAPKACLSSKSHSKQHLPQSGRTTLVRFTALTAFVDLVSHTVLCQQPATLRPLPLPPLRVDSSPAIASDSQPSLTNTPPLTTSRRHGSSKQPQYPQHHHQQQQEQQQQPLSPVEYNSVLSLHTLAHLLHPSSRGLFNDSRAGGETGSAAVALPQCRDIEQLGMVHVSACC